MVHANLRKINFRSRHRLWKYFYNENFQIYGMYHTHEYMHHKHEYVPYIIMAIHIYMYMYMYIICMLTFGH